MNIYSVRFKKRIQNDPFWNFKEIYIVPSVVIGRCDKTDDTYGLTNDGHLKVSTVYYIGVVWLSQSYAIEFWCDKKEVKHGR